MLLPTHVQPLNHLKFIGILSIRCALVLIMLTTSSWVWADEAVTLRLKWKHQFQFAGYYAALEQGYYKEKGFDVTIEPVNFQESVFEAIKSNNATFAIADSSIVLHRLQGEPVVVIAPIFQQSPLVLMTLAEANIKSPYDLIGKRVMYRKGDDGAPITAMLTKLGIDINQLQYQDHNFNDDLLAEKGIDAYSVYSTNQPFLYQEKDIQTALIDPANYGIDFYGDMLFTHEEYIRRNPKRAQDFLEASIKGWVYALENKEEIVELIKGRYGNDKSKASLMFEADETELMIKPNLVPLGAVIPERFNRIANIYKEIGVAPSSANLEGLLLSEYTQKQQMKVDKRTAYFILFIVFILIVIFCTLYVFNRKLKQAIIAQTHDLKDLNTQLTNTLFDIEEKNKALSEAKVMAESASREKSLFLANMSHEIRTPMNGIYGSLQLLKKQVEDNNSETLVVNALSSAKLLLTILNDILDFSKIEAGKLDLDYFKLDIADLVSSSVMDFKAEITKKSIEFNVSVDQEAHKFWQGDPVRIKQVISNLVSNAIKFTKEGSVTLSLSTPGDFVQITVSDTGIGMEPHEIDKLFSRFEQADSSITRDFGGTGLGMAISKSLVDLMGGDINVESQKGQGTTFTVILPLIPLQEEQLAEEEQAICSLENIKILIAEDNDINQFVIESMLEETGAEINIVENGEICLSAFKEFNPNIILMDIQMPVMDGLTACKEIRKENTSIPIVALTANVMKQDVENYLANGFNACIGKPIEEEELFEIMGKLLADS